MDLEKLRRIVTACADVVGGRPALAQILGVQATELDDWMAGTRTPPGPVALALAEILREAGDARRARPEPPGGGTSARLRVLVIDDNRDNAESLAAVLNILGHQAEWATTGQEGLRRARTLMPDAVLLDLWLPDIHGFEVARQLRREAGLERSRIIAMSGVANLDNRRGSLEAGCDGFFQKPVFPSDLQDALRAPKSPS